jgi:uncharacterized surface anchored protein
MEDHTPEEEVTHQLEDTERKNEEPGRNLVPVVLSSSPESTTATVAVVREEPAERSVREQAHEIMLTLESAMQQVCVWAERVEAQQSEIAKRELRRVVKTEDRGSVGSRGGADRTPEGVGGERHGAVEGTSGVDHGMAESYRSRQAS